MKRKLTVAQPQPRRKRKQETMIIFVNGKQRRVPREPLIEGLTVEEFIKRNADPIWLHRNEMWELLAGDEHEFEGPRSESSSMSDEIPF